MFHVRHYPDAGNSAWTVKKAATLEEAQDFKHHSRPDTLVWEEAEWGHGKVLQASNNSGVYRIHEEK